MQVEREVGAVYMPMKIEHKALLKVGMLNEEQEKKQRIRKDNTVGITRDL